MSHTATVRILGIDALYPKSQALDFSVPFDNGIRVIDWDDIFGSGKIYYGDEIDLKFWSLLNLSFGKSTDPENPLTLQEGYTYKYYYLSSVFDVYDKNNTRIIHKTGISSIAQMNIDFTIANSHQFWVIVDGNIGGYKFMFPAKVVEQLHVSDIEPYTRCGLQNIYLPDRIRPYSSDDVDNPEMNLKYLALFDEMQRWTQWGSLTMRSYDSGSLTGIGDYNIIDWNRNCPTNYFYMKGLYELQATGIPDDITKVPTFDPTKCYDTGDYVRGNTELTSYILYKVMSNTCQNIDGDTCSVDPYSFIYTIKNTSRIFDLEVGKRYYVNDIIRILNEETNDYIYYLVDTEFVLNDFSIDSIHTTKICTLLIEIKRFKRFRFFAEKINILYMQLALGLYPDLMPIQKYDETQNNRPVYEPWLIWGFYKFVWSKKTSDWGDDIDIPLFDLSPSWS